MLNFKVVGAHFLKLAFSKQALLLITFKTSFAAK